MKTREIKEALSKGQQFSNEAADWFTVVNPSKSRFCICYNGIEYRSYKNINTVSKRIAQLLNRGY